jgi:hypothetical protein
MHILNCSLLDNCVINLYSISFFELIFFSKRASPLHSLWQDRKGKNNCKGVCCTWPEGWGTDSQQEPGTDIGALPTSYIILLMLCDKKPGMGITVYIWLLCICFARALFFCKMFCQTFSQRLIQKGNTAAHSFQEKSLL